MSTTRCVFALDGGRGQYSVDWDTPTTSGSFGDVWFGAHIESGVPVVLKAAKPLDLAVKLLDQEIYVSKKLRSVADNLQTSVPWPTFRECIEYKSKPVIVWDKAGQGCTLQQYICEMPINQICSALGTSCTAGNIIQVALFKRVVGELLRAIVLLQENGIYHRDIKPENIIVDEADPDAPLKLIDFGSSVDWNTPFKRGLGTATCDPLYAAPEQRINLVYPDRFDVYSVGIIGLQCLVPQLSETNALRTFVAQLASYDDLVEFCNRAPSGHVLEPVLNDSSGAFRVLSGMLIQSPSSRITARKALTSGCFS